MRDVDWMRSQGLRPKKSFGQNFLHDVGVARRIAELATSPEGGTVLEIGAGMGALTEHLSARAGRVVAIERDRDLVPYLNEKFMAQPHVSIVEADAARHDWVGALSEGPRPHVVAGNLPYAITGRLVERTVNVAAHVACAVFMVQREVADRLCAPPGSKTYGMLSVFTQAAFEVRTAIKVSPGAFFPPPKVDSAVVVLEPHDVPRAKETPLFSEVVRRAFGARRKRLSNAWKGLVDKPTLQRIAAEADIDLGWRAETLSVEQFGRVTELLSEERGGAPVPSE